MFPHNIILFKLDFNVKFPLLRLLQYSSDLKGIILSVLLIYLNASLYRSINENTYWSNIISLEQVISIKSY